ncbi:hypothetical protein B9T11_07705 [Wohlfahrtiimonas chitiniclastica]|uniref:hypothetical protein n=1 Tax=Wohlfahrtiimonas chitiniclastica TaxID=400946 RepID=UPI000B97E180|nr:hypothetical protein [Wohlfahrtiimonas chitiniclastica]OYQ79817.1 hypothetical protein B9T11_07705 [Wohlfahrtiimonas chitiniclastica]
MKQQSTKHNLSISKQSIKRDVFTDHKKAITILISFGTLILISMAMLAFFNDQLGNTTKLIALVAMPIIMIISFVLNQYLRKKIKDKELHYKQILKNFSK